jgi:hypothetical protein
MRNGIFVLLALWICMPGIAQEDSLEWIPAVKAEFKPDPGKAMLFSLLPGMGQIYNRKYWKLPIVYGAFMGCAYAISWNNRNYQDYWNAYRDIMSDDPAGNDSWKTLVPGNIPPEEIDSYPQNNPSFVENLRRKKDSFRRFRDLSIIVSAGVYLISLLDAYVDAQLFDFDISPGLSMRIEPACIPRTTYTSQTIGINCNIKF